MGYINISYLCRRKQIIYRRGGLYGEHEEVEAPPTKHLNDNHV